MSKLATTKPVWNSSRPALKDIDWKNGPDRKLAHNTYRETNFLGNPCVRFHNTIIITYVPGMGYRINSGGFQTSTTKQRLNALLPSSIQIWQKQYVWYVSVGDDVYEFFDHMFIPIGN